jgi:hypothetical protein
VRGCASPLSLQMGAVPTGTAGMEPEPEAAETDDLQARLDALRNG